MLSHTYNLSVGTDMKKTKIKSFQNDNAQEALTKLYYAPNGSRWKMIFAIWSHQMLIT